MIEAEVRRESTRPARELDEARRPYCDTLQAQNATLEQQRLELQRQLAGAQEQLDKLHVSRLADAKLRDTGKDRAALLDRHNQALSVRVQELERRLADRDSRIQHLTEQFNSMTRLLSRERTLSAGFERRIR